MGLENAKESEKNVNDGFIVDLWERIFSFLSKVSVFFWIRKILEKFKKEISYSFVEAWVLGNLLAAIGSSLLVYYALPELVVLRWVIFGYAAVRVFEIVVYQLNVLLFDPYRAKKAGKRYRVKSVRRLVLLLLHNYVEIMFWYSAMAISLVVIFGGKPQLPWSAYIKNNVICVATYDPGQLMSSGSNMSYLSNLAFCEMVTGIIMTLISLARFISLLPPVEEIDE